MMNWENIRANISDLEHLYCDSMQTCGNGPTKTAGHIIDLLGVEDAAQYVAALVRNAAWDGRISREAKAWADSVTLSDDITANMDEFHAGAIHRAHLSQIAEAMPGALKAAREETAREETAAAVCAFCGCIIEDPEDVYTDYDGDPCCQDCFDDRCAICDRCGEVIDRDYAVWVADAEELICEDCADRYFYRCDECGGYFSASDIALEDDNRSSYICYACRDRYDYAQCADCGCIDRGWSMHWSDREEDYYCDDCYPDHTGSDNLHDYSYKPRPRFLCTDDDITGGRFYGVELEIDGGDDADDCADDLAGLTGDIYCKHDGSLGEDGVEIVTHPGTLRYHLFNLPWGHIVQTAREHDYTSHDAGSCGLHVHVGRDALPDDAPEKLIALVDAVWDELVVFSRRNARQLNHWAQKPDAGITTHDDADTAKDKTDKARARGRYQAVNLQNRNTIEFRMFRGSLVLQTIRATLQCVDILCEYVTRHTLTDCAGAIWEDIRAAGAGMNDFCAYCEKRGI